MLDCLSVALGGAIGSVLRYLIGLIPLKEQTLFPIKTFAINVLGCFVIGLIAALSLKSSNLNPRLVLFLKVGICGGFTTFSTFALESSNLLKNGHISVGLSNQEGRKMTAIAFRAADTEMGKAFLTTHGDDFFDLMVTLKKDTWKGQTKIQIQILDAKRV